MKKITILFGAVLIFGISSCNKCHECHYENNGAEIELGEYCGDELEQLEANGYADTSGNIYTVHCHEH